MLKKKSAAKNLRYAELDLLRGIAIAMMVAYHFCYNLSWMNWTQWRLLETPGWIIWRTCIVTTFLFIAGISFNLHRQFWRRWGQIVAAALLVSAASFSFAGERFIYFGILHFIAVGLLITRLCQPLAVWNMALGLLVVVVGLSYQNPQFNTPFLNWIGFASAKPNTEDYVPLFPWLGVLLFGMGLGARWQQSPTFLPNFISKGLAWVPVQASQFLQFLGRWPLSIYLLHQPILLGVMLGISPMLRTAAG
jgi:uncharacterized membrane protein